MKPAIARRLPIRARPPILCIGVILKFVLIGTCAAASAYGSENTQSLFKELATPGISGARRDALVTELSDRSFLEVATQAVQVVCASREFASYNPFTAKPWLEERCPEDQKIKFAAGAIWHAVIERAEAGSLSEPLAVWSMEARPVCERLACLNALLYRHYHDQAKQRLERLAADASQPIDIEIKAAEILVRKVDANAHIRALVKACNRIDDALTRSERFRFATEPLTGQWSEQNRTLIVNYGFSLLNEIDDGKSGKGYFLAGYLGRVIGIEPVRDGQGAFAPDQRLPQYQGEHGLKDSFFQDTVNNARQWWRKNESRFAEKGSGEPRR